MKTVIIGATPNTNRYAWMAASMLNEYGQEFVPVGVKTGEVLGKPILDIRKLPAINDVHTVTLYIGPRHQPEWYQYILSLKPKRVIFNPGTENREYESMLEANGIEVLEACTLVMLRTGQY